MCVVVFLGPVMYILCHYQQQQHHQSHHQKHQLASSAAVESSSFSSVSMQNVYSENLCSIVHHGWCRLKSTRQVTIIITFIVSWLYDENNDHHNYLLPSLSSFIIIYMIDWIGLLHTLTWQSNILCSPPWVLVRVCQWNLNKQWNHRLWKIWINTTACARGQDKLWGGHQVVVGSFHNLILRFSSNLKIEFNQRKK